MLDERQPVDVAVLDARRIRARRQQAPHLGREQETRRAARAQRPPEALLGQAVAVVRRGVEIVDAAA